MRRRVTFSRNVTLSLSRSCRCYCKYCAFATHQPHLHEPEEVLRLIDRAARRQVKELLVLTGEAPDHLPGRAGAAGRARLRRLHGLRGVGLRAGAGPRAAPTYELGCRFGRRPITVAGGHRLAGADAGVGAAGAGRAPGIADEGAGAAAGLHPRGRRAADPVHVAGSWSASGRARTSASRRSRPSSGWTTSRRSSSRTSSRTSPTTARSRPTSPTRRLLGCGGRASPTGRTRRCRTGRRRSRSTTSSG